MSAYKKRQKMLALSNVMAQAGAGIGSDGPMGNFAGNMGQIAANMAQAEAESEAQKEAEKKDKSGFLGSIGALLGTVGAAAIPGLSPATAALAGGLGSAAGSAAGQAIGGGGVDLGKTVSAGISGGMGGYMGSKALAGASAPNDASLAVSSGNAPAYAGDAVADAAKATTPSFGDRALSNLRGSLYANELLDPNRPASMSFMPQQGYGQQPYDPFQYLRPIR